METMTELIERLRDEAEWAQRNDWDVPLMLYEDLRKAADFIESVMALIIKMGTEV